MLRIMEEALTYDDVLLVPAHSTVLPNTADLRTRLTSNIQLNIPMISSAMDTVTESNLAIALAQEGGIGFIHKNMPIERQAQEIARVKRYENGMVRANTETAMLLEEILNTKITLDIDLFEPYQEDIKLKADTSNLNQTQGSNAQNLAKLGFGVVSTNKSPFDALAKAEIATKKKENPLIANLNVQDEQNTKTLKKMAISLKDLSLVTSSDPFFVLNDDRIKDSIDGIPVIKSWEMKEVENSKEFLRLIRERRNN